MKVNLQVLIERTLAVFRNSGVCDRIVIANDSTDGTIELASELAQKHEGSLLICRAGKLELGRAIRDTFRFLHKDHRATAVPETSNTTNEISVR